MPFVSEAQRAKFQEMVAEGKITQATYDEWEAATPKDVKLPERKHPKKPEPLKTSLGGMKGADALRKRFGL